MGKKYKVIKSLERFPEGSILDSTGFTSFQIVGNMAITFKDLENMGYIEPLEQEEKPNIHCTPDRKWFELKDCPASECDGEECECEISREYDQETGWKPKEPNESLESKMLQHSIPHKYPLSDFINRVVCVETACVIAKEHFTKNPEEITRRIRQYENTLDSTEGIVNESLEEKIIQLKVEVSDHIDKEGENCWYLEPYSCQDIIKMFKEHYQEHPNEIGCVRYGQAIEYIPKFAVAKKRLVSIDEVLRVFDAVHCYSQCEVIKGHQYEPETINQIRKAISNIGEK